MSAGNQSRGGFCVYSSTVEASVEDIRDTPGYIWGCYSASLGAGQEDSIRMLLGNDYAAQRTHERIQVLSEGHAVVREIGDNSLRPLRRTIHSYSNGFHEQR